MRRAASSPPMPGMAISSDTTCGVEFASQFNGFFAVLRLAHDVDGLRVVQQAHDAGSEQAVMVCQYRPDHLFFLPRSLDECRTIGKAVALVGGNRSFPPNSRA